MSATMLRDAVRTNVQRQVDAETNHLVMRLEDPIDRIRVRQGLVTGLNLALSILDEAYKDLHG